MTTIPFYPDGIRLALLAATLAVLLALEVWAIAAIRRDRRDRARSHRMARRIVSSYGFRPSGRGPKAPPVPHTERVSEAATAGEPPSRPGLPYPGAPLGSRRA